MTTAGPVPTTTEDSALLTELLALENAAMERWADGDPDGFLELSDGDVSYFDPWQERRLDSHAELTALYDTVRGTIRVEEYEFVQPAVVAAGDMATLSYRFVSRGSEGEMRWNCTEVFRRDPERGWRIVHTHWSLTGAGAS